jgi:pyridoxal phosphate enzyme (YggS family)
MIRQRIADAALRAGRDPGAVRLVAVSKTKPAAAIAEALECGQVIFGENYVQELVAKTAELPEGISWHFIGNLQSNKVRQIAGLVDMIHSVDRISLAKEIDRQWGALGKCCELGAFGFGAGGRGADESAHQGAHDHAPLLRRSRGGASLLQGAQGTGWGD